MTPLRTHPYLSALGGAIALIIVGVLVVGSHSSVAPSTSPDAWEGANAPVIGAQSPTYVPPPASGSAPQQPSIAQQVMQGAPYTYAPPQQQNSSSAAPPPVGEPFDYDAFVSQLEQGSSVNGTTSQGSTSVNGAYAFIPSGTISTTSSQQALSPTAQALYDYGNELGSYIQSYEEQHQDQAEVVKDQSADRTNPSKAAALQDLAAALSNVGSEIGSIDDTPPQAQSAQDALAGSYKDIGAKLTAVAQAQSDQAYVSAIQSYDTSADSFVQHYVAMATLFAAYGVKFAPDDPGSEFMFTPGTL